MSKGTNMNPNLEKCSQSNNAILETELELLLLEQQLQKQRQTRNLFIEQGNDLNMCRSGSAPPTIDGAMSSVGSLFRASNSSQLTNNNVSGSVTNGAMTEEEIRSHPAYLAYYYSSDNKNPRLPPPLLSREDWRIAQRVGSSFGGREDWRNNNVGDCRGSSSLFSNPPAHKADNELMLLRSATNNNLRKKSQNLVDQSMLERAGTDMGLRRKSFANIVQEGSGQHALASHMSRPSSHNSLIDSAVTSGVTTSTSEVFSNVYSRDVHGEGSGTNNMNRLSSDTSRIADVADSLAALSMSNNQFRRQDNHHLHSQLRHPQFHSAYLERSRPETTNYANGLVPPNINMSRHDLDGNQSLPRKAYSSANMQSQVDHPDFACLEEWNSYNMGNNNPAAGLEFQRALINAQMKMNAAILDPQHIHQRGNDHVRGDLHDMDMMYLENFLSQQKLQCQPPIYNSSDLHNLHHTYVGLNPYKGKHVGRSLYPDVGTGTAMYQNQRIPIVEKSSSSATTLHSKTETSMGGPASTLLEELKNNTRCLELPDVMGHVTEFSMDQYGSRFIQQKLVTATTEEKMKIFEEIRPYARSLMTDVFGNYVIQKIFEHGTQDQRKELASQLIGHVLPLSLQMYGCRVIQKALEVVDVEHQTKMVAELDGSVMKCVHDQNGNHVIQKCIEFVPSDKIQFIISSFFGQVVSLSMHPYGCRVIQRVLEHCNDPEAQNLIMDEIMQCICTLAQDQYGNYVIQHVLQRGKAHERSSIISQLAGQIVKMSQQKYASNVVEKCLTFGSPGERQILVKEMLGSTDENAPLQAMMKDPFGNYVVQKILETCDNKSRELILSRIKVHLNTLKRYTYGKHVVSRVEKLLITAGETPTNNQP